jgi:hypothetical protein
MTRLQDILLAILCIVAVGLSVLAYRTVNAENISDPQGAPARAAATFDDVLATTDDDVTTGSPDQETTTSDAPAVDASVAGWVEAMSDTDSDLLVVGDGYSALPQQWVQLWAGLEADDRPVTIRAWDTGTDSAFAEPVRLSDGEGPTLRVWNASVPDTTIGEAAGRFARFDDASSDQEAVLVSLGESSGGEDVPAELDALLEAMGDAPVLVVVGPSSLYDAGVGAAISAWAEEHDDRVAVVDLRDALGPEPTADEWAQAFAGALSEG